MNLKTITKSLTFPDLLLFGIFLLLSTGGIFYVLFALPVGQRIIIEIGSNELYTYSLGADRSISLREGISIEIKNGSVRVLDADCPRKLCVKQGWIKKGVIVCLPNKTVIRVIGVRDDSQNDIDATTR